MSKGLFETFLKSLLTEKQLEHVIFFVFSLGDSCPQTIPQDLIELGYVIKNQNSVSLTPKGIAYRDMLLQKLAHYDAAIQMLFERYFDQELSHLKKEIQQLKTRWRDVRNRRLELKDTLIKQGKDKAAIRKDKKYKELMKEQKTLRTRMRHVQKKYNKKIARLLHTLHVKDIHSLLPYDKE